MFWSQINVKAKCEGKFLCIALFFDKNVSQEYWGEAVERLSLI